MLLLSLPTSLVRLQILRSMSSVPRNSIIRVGIAERREGDLSLEAGIKWDHENIGKHLREVGNRLDVDIKLCVIPNPLFPQDMQFTHNYPTLSSAAEADVIIIPSSGVDSEARDRFEKVLLARFYGKKPILLIGGSVTRLDDFQGIRVTLSQAPAPLVCKSAPGIFSAHVFAALKVAFTDPSLHPLAFDVTAVSHEFTPLCLIDQNDGTREVVAIRSIPSPTLVAARWHPEMEEAVHDSPHHKVFEFLLKEAMTQLGMSLPEQKSALQDGPAQKSGPAGASTREVPFVIPSMNPRPAGVSTTNEAPFVIPSMNSLRLKCEKGAVRT